MSRVLWATCSHDDTHTQQVAITDTAVLTAVKCIRCTEVVALVEEPL